VKVRVDRVVVSGPTRAPDPRELSARIGDELRAAVRTDRDAFARNPTAAVAHAVTHALGDKL
jgi:hypothetical protein